MERTSHAPPAIETSEHSRILSLARGAASLHPVQGYLAHKKENPPKGHHRALGIVLV